MIYYIDTQLIACFKGNIPMKNWRELSVINSDNLAEGKRPPKAIKITTVGQLPKGEKKHLVRMNTILLGLKDYEGEKEYYEDVLKHQIEKEREKTGSIASDKYKELEKNGKQVLYDDRENKSAGEKFADADLIGIPYRLVISERTLKNNSVEIKKRDEKEINLIKIEQVVKYLKKYAQ